MDDLAVRVHKPLVTREIRHPPGLRILADVPLVHAVQENVRDQLAVAHVAVSVRVRHLPVAVQIAYHRQTHLRELVHRPFPGIHQRIRIVQMVLLDQRLVEKEGPDPVKARRVEIPRREIHFSVDGQIGNRVLIPPRLGEIHGGKRVQIDETVLHGDRIRIFERHKRNVKIPGSCLDLLLEHRGGILHIVLDNLHVQILADPVVPLHKGILHRFPGRVLRRDQGIRIPFRSAAVENRVRIAVVILLRDSGAPVVILFHLGKRVGGGVRARTLGFRRIDSGGGVRCGLCLCLSAGGEQMGGKQRDTKKRHL